MEDNKIQELQMKVKKRYIVLMLTISWLTVTCSGCGVSDDKGNDVQVLNVDSEKLQNTESSINTEEVTEFVEANAESEKVLTLDQYIGNWVCYYSDTSWMDISLYYMDGNPDDLCASVTEYYDTTNVTCYQDYVDVPVENNIIAGEDGFSYELIPQDNSLKVITGYPDSGEFEGASPEEYIFEKASDEIIAQERTIAMTVSENLDNQTDNISQDSTSSNEETETEEEKYSDEELITAALGYMDTAIADSIKSIHTTYEVDSVTNVTRSNDSGNYSVRFYILFDGHTYEYFTIKLRDFDGLQYAGHM